MPTKTEPLKPVSELARKLAEKVFEDLCHVSWEQECIRPQRKELVTLIIQDVIDATRKQTIEECARKIEHEGELYEQSGKRV